MHALTGLEAGIRRSAGGIIGGGTLRLRLDNILDARYRDHLSRVQRRDAAMPGRNVGPAFRRAF